MRKQIYLIVLVLLFGCTLGASETSDNNQLFFETESIESATGVPATDIPATQVPATEIPATEVPIPTETPPGEVIGIIDGGTGFVIGGSLLLATIPLLLAGLATPRDAGPFSDPGISAIGNESTEQAFDRQIGPWL